jgi:hypothetical protein
LAVLAFLLACNQLADYDTWWHLRTGELIPSRGIPETDWFSFSSADRVWIDVHWGFQVLITAVHQRAGIAGLVLLQATIVTLLLLVLIGGTWRAGPGWLRWSVLLVMLVAVSGRFNVRPELLSMLFVGLDLVILWHASQRPGLIWWLVPIQLLWSNVQSLYVLGPILLGVFVLEAILGGRARQVGGGRLLLASALVGGACLVSPYGIGNVLFLLEVFQKIDPQSGQIYRETIGELTPLPQLLTSGGHQAGYIAASLLLVAISVAGFFAQWRSICWGREVSRVLPTVLFGLTAWQAVRNVGQFAVVAAVLSIVNLGPKVPRWDRAALGSVASVMVCLALGIAWVGGAWSDWTRSDRQFGLGAQANRFATDAMRVCATPGMPDRAAVFHLGQSAVFIHECGPDRQVLMDPRLEVNSEETYRRYREIQSALEQGSPDGLALLDGLQIPLVVADAQQNTGIQATLFASPWWRCVHWDALAGVFVRSTHPLPGSVHDWKVLQGIFDQPVPLPIEFRRPSRGPIHLRPQGEDPGEGLRLVWLAQSLAQRAGRPTDLMEKILWRSLRRSAAGLGPAPSGAVWSARGDRAHLEQARAMASALLLMDRIGSFGLSEEEVPTPIRWLGGVGRDWGRWLLAESTGDANFSVLLAESLIDVGGFDESVAVLESALRPPADRRLSSRFRPELERVLDEKRRQLTARPAPNRPWEISHESYSSFVAAGRAGEYARRLRSSSTSSIPREIRPSLGWVVWRYEPSLAEKFFGRRDGSSSGEIRPMLPATTEEEGMVSAAQGKLLAGVFALLTADRSGIDRALAEIPVEDLAPADARWLEHVRDLLLDEPNPR